MRNDHGKFNIQGPTASTTRAPSVSPARPDVIDKTIRQARDYHVHNPKTQTGHFAIHLFKTKAHESAALLSLIKIVDDPKSIKR